MPLLGKSEISPVEGAENVPRFERAGRLEVFKLEEYATWRGGYLRDEKIGERRLTSQQLLIELRIR